jgi:Lrp/AsnC family transcriptional regulator for asnA, asnC and gidA
VDKTNLDTLDNKIIRLLTENGRMSMGEMAKKLNVTSPTIRNRIKDLEKNGIFKVSGLIDPNQHPQMTTALVAMSIRSHGKMDQVLKKIEVVCVGGKDELYRFTTNTILKIVNVVRSETFIILKSRNNWLCLPKGVKEI